MGDAEGDGIALGGDDRFFVDYLQSVLLSRLPPEVVAFLTRTSVLEHMSGPLCDAVLDRTGSADLLESLERSNLLLIPLDRRRRWYRYHHLFRELLRAKLDRGEAGAAGELLLRAAAWCEDNGLPEAAIEYAMEAGDTDRVARLVANAAFLMYRTGRLATVQRWFDWFDENGEIEQYSGLAVIGAWYHLVVGNLAASERWADAAQRGSLEGTPYWRTASRWRRTPARPWRPSTRSPSVPSWRRGGRTGPRPRSWSSGRAASSARPGWTTTSPPSCCGPPRPAWRSTAGTCRPPWSTSRGPRGCARR